MLPFIDSHICVNLVHVCQNGRPPLLRSSTTDDVDIGIRDLHSGNLIGDRAAASTPSELFFHKALQLEVKEVDVG